MSEDDQTYSAAAEVGQVRARRSRCQRAKIALGKAPISAWFGMIVIAIYAFVAIFAQLLAPFGEAEIFGAADLPWRMFEGGLIAAINRSWLDQLLSRGVDVLMSIPSLIFALMLLSIFGSSIPSLIMIIAVLDSTRVFRLTRSVAANAVVMDYVEAARLRGEGLGWIMRKEILPNIMPPLVAEFGLRFSFVFLTIAALSFLGLGIQPPTADWGSMVRDGSRFIQFVAYDWTLALPSLLPAGAVALLTVAVNFVVDWFLHMTSGLRDD